MNEIDYGIAYSFLVETGHLKGARYSPNDLFRFQPKDRPLFSEIVLFDSEQQARDAAAMIDEKPARIQLGMKLEVETSESPAELADLLEKMQRLGVDYVTFSSNSGRPDHGIPVDLAIIGFRSA